MTSPTPPHELDPAALEAAAKAVRTKFAGSAWTCEMLAQTAITAYLTASRARGEGNNLFKQGNFILHSGEMSDFLIDCSALSDDALAALARRAAQLVGPFCSVRGIPSGGLRFAEAMKSYATPHQGPHLIVDDVATTGKSFEEARESSGDIGLVIFARGPIPGWVTPLFLLNLPLPQASVDGCGITYQMHQTELAGQP